MPGTEQPSPGRPSEEKNTSEPGPRPFCRKCGKCCGPYFALYVEEEDEKRWAEEDRRDILRRLEWEREHVRWDEEGPYHNQTNERFHVCVYLLPPNHGHRLCAIHHTKPKICRDYPPASSTLCVLYKKS